MSLESEIAQKSVSLCTVKGVCARALRLYSNEDSAFRAGEHYDCTFLVREPYSATRKWASLRVAEAQRHVALSIEASGSLMLAISWSRREPDRDQLAAMLPMLSASQFYINGRVLLTVRQHWLKFISDIVTTSVWISQFQKLLYLRTLYNVLYTIFCCK